MVLVDESSPILINNQSTNTNNSPNYHSTMENVYPAVQPSDDDDKPPPYHPDMDSFNSTRSSQQPVLFEQSVVGFRSYFETHWKFVLFLLLVTAGVVLAVLVTMKQSNDNSQDGGYYGAKCTIAIISNQNQTKTNETNPTKTKRLKNCDKSQNLMCNSTTQTCTCPGGMYYKQNYGCLGFAGHPCSIFDQRPCTPHSTCYQPGITTPGICVCDNGFSPVSNGLCLIDHGKSGCGDNGDCNNLQFLICDGGLCTCDARYQRWDDGAGICASLAGGRCTFSKQCIGNSSCLDNQCKCDRNYRATDEGTCALDYNTPCNRTANCHPTFICTPTTSDGQRCLCRPAETYKSPDCIAKVGSPCFPGRNKCDTDSHCGSGGNCTCDDGYSQTKTNKCLANLAVQCNLEHPCNYELFLNCSEASGMCECRSGFTVDEEQRCVVSGGFVIISPSFLLVIIIGMISSLFLD